MRSLIIDTITTKANGTSKMGTPSVCEIAGIMVKKDNIKKYKFDILENCSNKFNGKKLRHVYLLVQILFEQKGFSVYCFLLLSFGGYSRPLKSICSQD